MVETLFLGPIGKSKLLVLSDLHVGDPRQHPGVLRALATAVAAERPTYIVLAGDVLEGNLATEQQIDQLRTICKSVEAQVVLKGNHDRQETSDLAMSLRCNYGLEVVGRSGVADFAIEHGDHYDTTWRLFPGVGWVSIWINRLMYRIFRFDMQAYTRKWAWVQKKLRAQHEKAWKAWSGKAIVITGHTHLPTDEPSGVGYFNSGDWLVHRSYCVLQDGVAHTKWISTQ